MRILITGSNGQLGTSLIGLAPKSVCGYPIELITTKRSQLDLSRLSICRQFIKNIKPDWVINAAAFTAVDDAEENSRMAYLINADAPLEIALALKETGGKLIHISTDYVFNGNNFLPYKPYDKRLPLSIYGMSKAKGEDNINEVLSFTSQSIILRTSWLMGATGNNFILTMLRLMREKKRLKIVSDQISSPTSTTSLAKMCWRLIEENSLDHKFPSVMHWSDAGIASWYDIACSILDFGQDLGLVTSKPEIIPINTDQYPMIAERPIFSKLDCTNSVEQIGTYPLHWRYELRETLCKIAENQI